MSMHALIRSARARRRGGDIAQGGPHDRTIHHGIGPAENEDGQQASSDALARVMSCIPAEIVLVYVATTAAITSDATVVRTGQWVAFWAYLVATPLTVLLGAAAAGATPAERRGLLALKKWPLVEMLSSASCFAIWGFTLPGTPFADFSWYRPAVATVVLLAGSLVIGLVTPLYGLTKTD